MTAAQQRTLLIVAGAAGIAGLIYYLTQQTTTQKITGTVPASGQAAPILEIVGVAMSNAS